MARFRIEAMVEAVERMTPAEREQTAYNVRGSAAGWSVASLIGSVPDWREYDDLERARRDADFFNVRGPFRWVQVVQFDEEDQRDEAGAALDRLYADDDPEGDTLSRTELLQVAVSLRLYAADLDARGNTDGAQLAGELARRVQHVADLDRLDGEPFGGWTAPGTTEILEGPPGAYR